MTARLKHKLELENVNLKSAYINESFVQVSLPYLSQDRPELYRAKYLQIGTPLPALSGTKKDKLEYVPEWQQEVSSLTLIS